MLDPFRTSTKIETPPGKMIITIPARRTLITVVFLAFWLFMWTRGWNSAASQIADGHADAFLYIWITAWTFGGLLACLFVLWSIIGKEIVTLTTSQITVKRTIAFLSRKSVCDLNTVTNLGANGMNQTPEGFHISSSHRSRNSAPSFFSPRRSGAITFDHGVHTIGFGLGLDDAEAKRIAEMIRDRYPMLGTQNI